MRYGDVTVSSVRPGLEGMSICGGSIGRGAMEEVTRNVVEAREAMEAVSRWWIPFTNAFQKRRAARGVKRIQSSGARTRRKRAQ